MLKRYDMNKLKIEFLKELANGITPIGAAKTVKELWPEHFEVKLEVGKWGKGNLGVIAFRVNTDDTGNGYGFDVEGNWTDFREQKSLGWAFNKHEDWQPATDKEVEEMLIKEAKKRFGDNVVQCLFNYSDSGVLDFDNNHRKFVNNDLYIANERGIVLNLFDSGKWATIIEQPLEQTIEQVSEKYGREVKIIKK